STQRHAAAELRTGEADDVAQHPQQGHVAGDIDRVGRAVDTQRDHGGSFSSLQVVRPQAGLTPYTTGGLPAGVKEVRSSSLFASEATMSTDTTVVLVHSARLVRCTVPILVGVLALAAPLVGQARHGHFYHVNYYQVRPGQEKAYDSALVNVVTPVFDELVKRRQSCHICCSPRLPAPGRTRMSSSWR